MRSRFTIGLGTLLAAGTIVACSDSDVAGPESPGTLFNVGVECPTDENVIQSGGGTSDDCVSLPGRMTGGGRQITIGNVAVTRGFTIHCDIALSNNIEVNWPGNHFHITKPLTFAQCVDDPTIAPEPPAAPFDTFLGEADGRLNGVDGALIRFIFADAGEPGGRNDRAHIEIYAPDGSLALMVPYSFLTGGNLQAHYDQPHK